MSEWIKVCDQMPEHDKTVLLVIEQYCVYLDKLIRRVIRGCHIDGHKLDSSEWDDWEDTTYDEDDDIYYVNARWFENVDNNDTYTHIPVEDEWKVTHWMPLPELPVRGDE